MFAAVLCLCLSSLSSLRSGDLEALEQIVVPSVEFAETPMKDGIEFLVQRSRELDAAEEDPNRKGINVVLLGDFKDEQLTLRLAGVPLGQVLHVVAELVDAKVEVGPEVVVISRGSSYEAVKRKEGSEPLEARLRRIVIPSIEFQDTPLKDALEFLQQRSSELDKEREKGVGGVNIVLKGRQPVQVSLRLQGVSLYAALEMTVRNAGYQMEIREHMVFVDLVDGGH